MRETRKLLLTKKRPYVLLLTKKRVSSVTVDKS